MRELVAKWIEALESDKYQQGKIRLRSYLPWEDMNFYCCLGVLTEISGKYEFNTSTSSFFSQDDFVYGSLLPRGLVEELGISEGGAFRTNVLDSELINVIKELYSPLEIPQEGVMELIVINDLGVPFKTIAQIIRQVEENDGWV